MGGKRCPAVSRGISWRTGWRLATLSGTGSLRRIVLRLGIIPEKATRCTILIDSAGIEGSREGVSYKFMFQLLHEVEVECV